MTFEELGAMLRQEREKRRLSMDEVANKLKINARLLRAIEAGDSKALPHPAYVRGFIRSYASWLGIGAEEINRALTDMASGDSGAKGADPENNKKLDMESPARPRSHRKMIIFLFVCVICSCVWYAWENGAWEIIREKYFGARDHGLQSAEQYMAARDKADEARRQLEPEPAKEPDEDAAKAEKLLPLPGNHRETVLAPIARVQPEPPAEAAEAVREPEPMPAQPENSAEQAAAPSSQHKVIITATEECWVHSNADKTDTRQFSLRKGDTFALAFSKNLELKLGNAGGVRIRYDGKEMPPAGASGQVRTITFPPAEN